MGDVEVAGIDLSLTATGIATAAGVFTVKSVQYGDDIPDRLARMIDIVASITARIPVGSIVVIEGPSYGQRQQVGEHQRAGLWWLVASQLDMAGVHMIEVPPATLKKFATGKGNATKADMRMALFQRAVLDLRDDNQVDAWWLRELGKRITGRPSFDLPKTHLAALEKVRVPL